MFISRIKQRLAHIKRVAYQLTRNENQGKKIIKSGWQNLLLDQVGLKGKQHTLELYKFGQRFSFSTDNVSDFSLLYHLLVNEEYQRVRTLKDASSIIDLGSNVGVSVIYFHMLFPEARITAYEPDPQNYRQLLTNFKLIPDGQVYPYAVGNTAEEVCFYPIPNRGVSSSLINRKGNKKPIQVKQVTLDDVLKGCGKKEVDILKFDVEGAEYGIFKNCKSINQVKIYIGELHSDLMECDTDTFCQLFRGYKIEREQISFNRILFFAQRKEERATEGKEGDSHKVCQAKLAHSGGYKFYTGIACADSP